MSLSNPSLSPESVIINSKPEHLYTHDFKGKGKYISVVHRDNQGATLQASPFIQLKVIYIFDKDEICGFEITKVKKTSSNGRYDTTSESIKLSGASLGHIVDLAEFIKEHDLKGISQRRIKLSGETLGSMNDATKKSFTTLLSSEEGQELVKAVLGSGQITSGDIVNVGYRRNQLSEFKKLLDQDEYWKEYAKSEVQAGEAFDTTKEEKAYQHFFSKNPWIFGYGLDYQFLEILQDESTVRGADVSGKGEEKLDTLAGAGKYTVLIELKKPSTKLFDATQNRSNSWRLSGELFSAVSQILEYKASHLTEWLDESKRFDNKGSKIVHQALDSKAILVVGRDSMFVGSEKTIDIKWRTFELFRRDSRNVRIFTYDELYDRARFIVERSAK